MTALPHPGEIDRTISLADVLDRVLTKGTVVVGEIVISVAGVELVYLGLNVVASSVETVDACVRPRT
jgi:hypothetical protein